MMHHLASFHAVNIVGNMICWLHACIHTGMYTCHEACAFEYYSNGELKHSSYNSKIIGAQLKSCKWCHIH